MAEMSDSRLRNPIAGETASVKPRPPSSNGSTSARADVLDLRSRTGEERTVQTRPTPEVRFTEGGPRLRIVHICTRFARGGSEQRLSDMIAATPELDHHLIIGPDSDVELAQQRLPAASVTIEPTLRRAVHPLRDARSVLRLRRRIMNLDADAVVTHQSKAGALGRVAARAAGVRRVIHSLSMASFGSGYGAAESVAFRRIEHALVRWTSAYAVVGRDLASGFGKLGVPADRLRVIRSAARLPDSDTDRAAIRRRLAQKFDLPVDRPWILKIGSLDRRKSVLELPILLQQTIELTTGERPFLVVAGSGPERAELAARLDQVGVGDDCALIGHVQDPSDLFVAADVVVLLSKAEGLPQVLVQAAAAGTPFVSTEVSGVDELLELGAAGTIVEVGDIVGAARALLPYLRWPVLRTGSTIDLSSWRHDHVRDQYRQLFSELLAPALDVDEGLVVALIGSDGAGKSSLSTALLESIGENRPVEFVYFGSGDGPSSLLRWPMKKVRRLLLGERSLRTRQSHPDDKPARHLSAARAVWALALAREKTAKLNRARRAAARGAIVICDRYPQAQVAGSTDGPLLAEWTRSNRRWQRAVGTWEARPYRLAERHQPDLVLRLLVDQATATSRRPNHDPTGLMKRRSIVESLEFRGARFGVVDIDTRRPPEEVLALAVGAIEGIPGIRAGR